MRRRFLLFAAALGTLVFIPLSAAAAPRIVYRGMVQGASEVVMELDREPAADGSLSGRYFYARNGVDIPLHGTPANLREPRVRSELPDEARAAHAEDKADFDDAAASWQGMLTRGGYRGRWVAARTGVAQPFALRRVAEYDPQRTAPSATQAIGELGAGGVGSGVADDAQIDMRQAPYETLKLAGHAQPVGPEIGNATLAYRMWRDPRTVLRYPRLSRFPDPAAMARINHLLEQRHWRMSLAALACQSTRYTSDEPAAGTLGGYDDEQVRVTWLSTALLGLTESGSVFCGGAYPDNHFDAVTLDVLRGSYLDWNRLIPNAYVSDADGNRVAGPVVMRWITHDPRPGAQDGDGNRFDCRDDLRQYLAPVMSAPDTLLLAVSDVGHAEGACLGPQVRVRLETLERAVSPQARRYLVPSVEVKSPREPAR